MNPQGNRIEVNLQQLDANIHQAETELALWKFRLEAMIERGMQEAQHVKAFCKSQGYDVAHPYLMALKKDYEAQGNLIQLTVAKLQSQIQTMKAMREEATKSVVVPGHFS